MGILNFFKKKKKKTLSEDIKVASEWIASALNSSQYKADFSLESLKELDRFFDEQQTKNGLLSGRVGSKLFALSAYLGEVLLKSKPGVWITDDNDPQGELNISIKFDDGSEICPAHRVINRYKNGAEDSLYAYGYVITQEK